MGSSFTDFLGHGFWTSDGKLEIWLMALCDEVDGLTEAPPWLVHAREHWHTHATVGFMACVDAGLNKFVGSNETRVAVLRELGKQASLRLQSAPTISRDTLSAYGVGGPGQWTSDVATATLMPIAMAFDALLAGTLMTDAASSPML